MDTNFELYDGKSFQDICKDIVINQSNRKEQIEIFISDLRPLIKTANDALQLVPLIKQYIDAGISNDEHLIKLAVICQRIMANISASETAGGGGSYALTMEEKKELMASIEEIEKSGDILSKKISDTNDTKKS